MYTKHLLATATAFALAAAATAAHADPAAEGIQVPAGHALQSSVHAVGHQIYECKAGASGPQWTFKAPEATLSADGKPVGTHYAGPTWESTDGSKVMGKVVASAPSAGTIPHLLLQRKDGAGAGRFEAVTYVVRRETRGGLAPTEACDAASLSRVARSPYEATYDFYVVADVARRS